MSSPTVIVNSTPVVKVSYGLPGIGVPSGGIKPQVLKKSSSADYATEWGDVEVLMLDRTDLTFTGTLSKGDPVYINSSGQIAACDAADSATLPPVGLVAGDVTDPEDDVDVILVGALIDANTATFSIGDRLYVAVGGGITATAPSGTDASYSVGVVSKVDSTEGIISVYVDGSNNTFEGLAQNQIWVGNANGVATQYTHQLSTLVDVDSSMSPSANDFLRYSGTQWEASSSPFTFDDITGLDHLPQGHVYVGDSSNLTSTTDTIYVDVANSRVGIGTTSPQEALHVDGRINLGATPSSGSIDYILIGQELPSSLGPSVVGVGIGVFGNATSANGSVGVGTNAHKNSNGLRNTALGVNAMLATSGATGSDNVAVGANTLLNVTSGHSNSIIGSSAGRFITSGSNNVAVGGAAGGYNVTGDNSVYLGISSGQYSTGSGNVLAGYGSGLGSNGQSTFENTVAVGYEALTALTTGEFNTAIGYEALHDLTTGSRNTVLGYQAGDDLTTQTSNTLIGHQTSGAFGSTAVGVLAQASGANAVSIGIEAQANNTNAVAIGTLARVESLNSLAIGSLSRAHERGVFVGHETGRYNNGEGNTVIGYEAGTGSTQQPGSTYNYNVLLGYRAGHQLETGSGNVFIGYGAGSSTLYDNHRLRISGQSLGVPNATDLIYGEFDNEFVKINGDLEVRDDIVSSNNEDITIIPDGTGHVLLGNYEFDTNQTLAPALDRYVLTYDGNTQEISLQENPALEGELEINLIVETVRNGAAVTLNKGTVVYITGEDVDGNTIVDVANNTDPNKMPASFVLNEDIAASATGQAVFSGLLDAVNTAAFSVGDVVYVGDNGNFVSERPESPNVIQEIAIVANVSATEGKVYVSKDVKEDPEKIHFPIRNDEGAIIPAGTPIYSKGEIGGSERILVGIADASDPAKMPAIGIATTQLTTTGADKDGLAIMVGTYNTNISGFTGLADNDVLYVDSGGGLTKDKPTGTNLIQNVGIVLKTGGSGTICQGLKVSCIGRTNDVPNIATGNIWAGDANGAAQATDTAYIDIANSRVGVGTSTPDEKLHVVGQIKIDDGSSPYTFPAADGTADQVLTTDGLGNVTFSDVASEDTNLANTNLTLDQDRTHDLSDYALNFSYDGSNVVTISGDNSEFTVNGLQGISLASAQIDLGASTVLLKSSLSGDTNPATLRFYEGGSTQNNFVGLRAPASLGSNPTFTLPDSLPSNGDVLTSSATGVMSWTDTQNLAVNIGNTNLTLTGNRYLDVDGRDFEIRNSTATPLISYDSSADDLSLGRNTAVQGDVTVNTPSGVSNRGGRVSLREHGGSNKINIQAPASLGGDNTYTLPDDTPTSNDSILVTSTSGQLEWKQGVVLNATNDGILGGDLTINGDLVVTGDIDFSGLDAIASSNTVSIQELRPNEIRVRGDFPNTPSVGDVGVGSRILEDTGDQTTIIAAGKLYGLGATAWDAVNPSSDAAKRLLGVGINGITDSTEGMLIEGTIRVNTLNGTAIQTGMPVYIDTSNNFTVDAPTSSGDIVRVVGYVLASANNLIYFKPDNTWVEL